MSSDTVTNPFLTYSPSCKQKIVDYKFPRQGKNKRRRTKFPFECSLPDWDEKQNNTFRRNLFHCSFHSFHFCQKEFCWWPHISPASNSLFWLVGMKYNEHSRNLTLRFLFTNLIRSTPSARCFDNSDLLCLLLFVLYAISFIVSLLFRLRLRGEETVYKKDKSMCCLHSRRSSQPAKRKRERENKSNARKRTVELMTKRIRMRAMVHVEQRNVEQGQRYSFQSYLSAPRPLFDQTISFFSLRLHIYLNICSLFSGALNLIVAQCFDASKQCRYDEHIGTDSQWSSIYGDLNRQGTFSLSECTWSH